MRPMLPQLGLSAPLLSLVLFRLSFAVTAPSPQGRDLFLSRRRSPGPI